MRPRRTRRGHTSLPPTRSFYVLHAAQLSCSPAATWLQAGNNRTLVSFQRVIVPLLHLVTSRRFLNNPLTELSNPVLARIADTLDPQAVATCLSQLAAAGSIADADPRHTVGEVGVQPSRAPSSPLPHRVDTARASSEVVCAPVGPLSHMRAWDPAHVCLVQRDRARWAPADCGELAQPIAAFFYEVLLKFEDKRRRLAAGASACTDAITAFCSSLEEEQGRAPLHAVVAGRVEDIHRCYLRYVLRLLRLLCLPARLPACQPASLASAPFVWTDCAYHAENQICS